MLTKTTRLTSKESRNLVSIAAGCTVTVENEALLLAGGSWSAYVTTANAFGAVPLGALKVYFTRKFGNVGIE